ncbi:hypothetical protein GA0115240_134728 [Streptomyces sp. DvalAA-14]|nr:hypothetical protein GA0115240_134728 [Streptomyces sp. DvalAA-14]
MARHGEPVDPIMPRSGHSVRAASGPARESVAICDLVDSGSSVAVRM